VAAAAWQGVREIFPVANNESDYSVKIRLELMAEVIAEVGQEAFLAAVKRAISISQRRYDVTVARIRECAGLRYVPPPSPTALAWEFVTQTFLNHVRTDGDGNYRLEDKVVVVGGVASVTGVPKIPFPIKRAISALGGWAAIAEAWPEYIGQKYAQFKELYHEDSGLRVDRPAGELERIG
jgi:hypothetical protein